jgi:peptide/nickel transport system substrate-binding protein
VEGCHERPIIGLGVKSDSLGRRHSGSDRGPTFTASRQSGLDALPRRCGEQWVRRRGHGARRKLQPVDQKTFTLELAEPFGLVLEALGKPSNNVPFMMLARLAATSADEALKESIGSGPFKFVKEEWQPGQAVYIRNAEYLPRQEPPSGSAGGKAVYLDKVIWRYLPDPEEAAFALATGEVDWWELPPLEFVPKISQNPTLRTFVFDPLGTQGWLRPNHLHPPFNNRKAREALLHMMDQVTYLALAIGLAKDYPPCHSVFSCSSPYTTTAGAEPMVKHDLDKARRLVQESGYDGRPVVVLQPTDLPFIKTAALVTRRRLEAIGFKVELRPMDWSTNLAVRARKDPPSQGGWNLLHTWWNAVDVINPAVHFGLSGAGLDAWYGWPMPRASKS